MGATKSVERKMSESNRVGFLKKSKKYATGREYNTLEGRIKIVNRYLENGEIMIAYLLNGEVIAKSELDVNTMLYRYTKELSKQAHASENTQIDHSEVLPEEETYDIAELKEDVQRLTDMLKSQQDRYEKIIDQQFELIKVLMEANKKEGA